MNTPRHRRSPVDVDALASDWVVRRDLGLTDAEERAFNAWLAEDPRHADAVNRHAQAWSLLGAPQRTGREADLLRQLARRSTRRRRLGLVAAGLLVCGGIGFVPWSRQAGPDRVFPPGAVVVAPERRQLPDGSVVELKRGAEIAVSFDAGERRILLRQGEALFEVARDPARPFVVRAGPVAVRAVGTAFVVRRSSAGVDVLITHGEVAVEKTSNAADPRDAGGPAGNGFPTRAGAGTLVVVGPGPEAAASPPKPISARAMEERLAWRAVRMEFSDTPLAEAVALMNRYAAIPLRIDDAELGRVPVSGRFRANNLEALLRLLEAGFGVEVERRPDVIILRRQP